MSTSTLAEPATRSARRLGRDEFVALHEEVRRRQRDGDLDGAIDLLRRLIDAAPSLDRLRADLVTLLRLAGDEVAADRLAVELDPSDVGAWSRLSRVARRSLDDELFVEASLGWAAAAPDDPVVAHFADIARQLRDGLDVERANDGYVRRVFDGYADRFDAHLASLRYRGPEVVAGLVADLVADADLPTDAAIADLGCGTGLVGHHLRAGSDDDASEHPVWNGCLVGDDLSPRMLEHTAARRLDGRPVYDALAEADFVTFLDARPGAFDAVVAADAFIYVGDLDPVLRGAARSLRPGGWLVATVERAVAARDVERGFAGSMNGRFVHADGYVERTLASAGFELVVVDELSVRIEQSRPVPGLVMVARMPQS